MEFNHNVNFDRILSSAVVQEKVIKFIQHWMERYWEEDWHSNPKLVSYCKKFMKRAGKAYKSDDTMNKDTIQKGKKLMEKLNQTILDNQELHRLKLSDRRSNSNDDPKKKKRKHGKSRSKWNLKNWNGGVSYTKLPEELLEINHIILAEQITVMMFVEFKKIQGRECLNQSSKHKDKKNMTPNIYQYIKIFNELTKWIQSSILAADNVKIRGRTIKKWIKVEQELYKLRNFQGLCAIHSALGSQPIYRLKGAWSYVPKKHMIEYERIKIIMKPFGNFKHLRQLQLQAHPPMIPYWGIFSKDLFIIEEITNNRRTDGSIDWNVLWRLKAAIDKYLIYQDTPYNQLLSNEDIQTYIDRKSVV